MPLEFADSSTYTVQSGDTLGQIATDHGIALDALLAANAGLINDPGLIQVGWELVIPGTLAGPRRGAPPSGEGVSSYTVSDGDTLGILADRWGTTVQAIVELNGIANPSLIFVGQRIRRPGATGPAPIDEPGASAVVAATTNESALLTARRTQLAFSRMPLEVPPAVITGGYRQDYGGYLHRGIDLGGAPMGTPIFAPAPGTLTVHLPGDGWGDGSFGICVVIDHPGTPWWSIYAHMNATNRTTGEVVTDGDVIGEVGFTGRVDPPGPAGAHTHWQLSSHSGFPPGFEYIANPLDFLVLP
jgi:murein DD-endopeptidase MepM/ murein hydrolase activator NlpD